MRVRGRAPGRGRREPCRRPPHPGRLQDVRRRGRARACDRRRGPRVRSPRPGPRRRRPLGARALGVGRRARDPRQPGRRHGRPVGGTGRTVPGGSRGDRVRADRRAHRGRDGRMPPRRDRRRTVPRRRRARRAPFRRVPQLGQPSRPGATPPDDGPRRAPGRPGGGAPAPERGPPRPRRVDPQGARRHGVRLREPQRRGCRGPRGAAGPDVGSRHLVQAGRERRRGGHGRRRSQPRRTPGGRAGRTRHRRPRPGPRGLRGRRSWRGRSRRR